MNMKRLMNTQKILTIFTLVLPLVCGSSVSAADGFDSVHCGSDLRKALIGHKMSNEPVSVLEERHKDLGLKDLGASEISDRLSAISWRVCDEDCVVLEGQNVV